MRSIQPECEEIERMSCKFIPNEQCNSEPDEYCHRVEKTVEEEVSDYRIVNYAVSSI